MVRYLAQLGVVPEVYIPDRLIDGYGPIQLRSLSCSANGARLLVTVDCGSTSFEAFEEAKRLGLEVIVLDHHQWMKSFRMCSADQCQPAR